MRALQDGDGLTEITTGQAHQRMEGCVVTVDLFFVADLPHPLQLSIDWQSLEAKLSTPAPATLHEHIHCKQETLAPNREVSGSMMRLT